MPKPGYFTPSSFADLMTAGRGGEEFGKTAQKVIDTMVLDLLNVARPMESTPASCQWGLDHEWEAIQLYQERTFRQVVAPVDFRVSKTHPYVGGTMDGLVGRAGGIEVKSPFSSSEHLGNLTEARQFNTIYRYQLQGYFWIYALEWIDCVSYDPRFPAPDNLAIHRVYPDEETITRVQRRCERAREVAMQRAEDILLGGTA